jgi:hypothetical protein
MMSPSGIVISLAAAGAWVSGAAVVAPPLALMLPEVAADDVEPDPDDVPEDDALPPAEPLLFPSC